MVRFSHLQPDDSAVNTHYVKGEQYYKLIALFSVATRQASRNASEYVGCA